MSHVSLRQKILTGHSLPRGTTRVVPAVFLAFCSLSVAPRISAQEDDDFDWSQFETDTDLLESEEYETIVVGETPVSAALPEERSVTAVSREDMERRLPRSAPDALRYEPGVFVQQTAHSQGSAYIRGMTGQQTLLMFDGIRLNNSTYRQGPNQYFFTLDSQTIQSIEVMRGGGSTLYGSDALGGVISAIPVSPVLLPHDSAASFQSDPRLTFRMATADREVGGRVAENLAVTKRFALFGGVGFRRVENLKSGGPLYGAGTGDEPLVPRFDSDGKTQLGTGFDEFTADAALRLRLTGNSQIKLAGNTYRQLDAPRTDQCPAAYAPYNECLVYDEQFRNLIYAAYEGEPDRAFLHSARATLSFQQQHERYTLHRPSAYVSNTGRDEVFTAGSSFKGATRTARPNAVLRLRLEYGIDTYLDFVQSHAWISFDDIDHTRALSRGQYIDGSRYLYGGAFLQGSMGVTEWLRLHAGVRASWIHAESPEDPESRSAAVQRTWIPGVWNAGLEIAPTRPFSFIANVDRSFRAPNLDDLTSRQQTGPGFQFENARLEPEHTMSYEAGVRLKSIVNAEVRGFITHLYDAILRSPRSADKCPENTPQCEASWNRFQLVNAADLSVLYGVEGVADLSLENRLRVRTAIAWTFGEGPNTGDPPSDPNLNYEKRVPLSRVPPMNGSVELTWNCRFGFAFSGMVRWATAQTRLALSDVSDERIPQGGTPGFAVLDLNVSYRPHPNYLVSVACENLFDTAYRYHGSSVNGPGRGIMLLVSFAPVWRAPV